MMFAFSQSIESQQKEYNCIYYSQYPCVSFSDISAIAIGMAFQLIVVSVAGCTYYCQQGQYTSSMEQSTTTELQYGCYAIYLSRAMYIYRLCSGFKCLQSRYVRRGGTGTRFIRRRYNRKTELVLKSLVQFLRVGASIAGARYVRARVDVATQSRVSHLTNESQSYQCT